jgi:Flp pilus assembly protein TadG
MKGIWSIVRQLPEGEIMRRGSSVWRKGQALVEMTLMLPIILIFVGGLTDVGLAFFVGTSLQNAVREGARLAAAGVASATVQAEVANRVYAPNMFTPAFSSGNVTVSGPNAVASGCQDVGGAASPQQSFTVTATGTYNYLFLRMVGLSTVSMSRSGTMRSEGTDICY